MASQFFPNGFSQPPLALVDLRADARLVPLRCTNTALSQGLSQRPGAEQALLQLVQVVQTAFAGQASPAEEGLRNLQVFSRQQTGLLQADSQQLQSLLQGAERAGREASAAPPAPVLALTDEPAPAAAAEQVQPQPESTPSAGLLQQPVPPEPRREESSSSLAGVEASMQALALQHYGSDLAPVSGSGEQGVPDPATSEAKTSRKGRGKGGSGRGKGKVKVTGQKGRTVPETFKRPAAAVATLKRPAAAPSARSRTLTVQECRRLRPQGCSKCRQRPGCCSSCWRGRSIVVV